MRRVGTRDRPHIFLYNGLWHVEVEKGRSMLASCLSDAFKQAKRWAGAERPRWYENRPS